MSLFIRSQNPTMYSQFSSACKGFVALSVQLVADYHLLQTMFNN